MSKAKAWELAPADFVEQYHQRISVMGMLGVVVQHAGEAVLRIPT